MRVGIQLCLLVLMFVVGWASRGLFDNGDGHKKAISSLGIAQNSIINSDESLGESLDEHSGQGLANGISVQTEKTDYSSNGAIDRDTTDRETADRGINERLIVLFEKLLFQDRIAETSKFVKQYSAQFTSGDIELLGAIFVSYALQMGLDEYQGSFELMNIEVQLSSLDLHAPSSQFFDVLEQAYSDPLLALRIFDELSSYYQEQVSESQLGQLENWLINFVDKNLRTEKDWLSLEAWYQALISRSADSENYHRRLAALYFDLGRNLESLDVLDKLASNFSNWNKQDEQLYQANTVAVASDSVEAIPLQRAGEHYIVKVRMNNRLDVPMLLDTGASISGLDRQFASTQGFSFSGQKIRLSTAGGRVDADLVRLASVAFGDNQLLNLDVASIDLNTSSGSSYQGLLGMDVLGQFKFYLDQRQAILYLRPNSNVDGLPPEF